MIVFIETCIPWLPGPTGTVGDMIEYLRLIMDHPYIPARNSYIQDPQMNKSSYIQKGWDK